MNKIRARLLAGIFCGIRREVGFSLIEVLVGLAILAAGLIAIAAIFPTTLQAGRDAELITRATGLAQQKAEEIRRDNDREGRLIAEIRARTTPTDPLVFPNEPRLEYSFSGTSLLYPFNAADPRSTPGIARVIIRYAPSYRPHQEVLYELRFN
jgi:prepilin-type N-terminal cleavage/methylation domain-containing protein